MEKIAIKLNEALTFIQPYIPLIDSHMVTFFTKNLWETHVPSPIKREFNENIVDNVVGIFSKAFSRGQDLQFKELNKFVQSAIEMDVAKHEALSISELKKEMNLVDHDFSRPPLLGFMSKKKSHEANVLVEIVAALTHHTSVTHVVEIGDGKGYVSSLLAMQHGINVLGLERSEGNIQGAEKRKSKLYKHGNRFVSSETDSLYRQSHTMVGRNTNIGQVVQHNFPDNWPNYVLGINGLHTCGDLSPICLDLFLDNIPQPRFLINVGCCYHLLNTSEEHNDENPSGFPLSLYMQNSGFNLSRNARMMALQPPFKLFHINQSPSISLMYRAVLEKLLDDTFGPGNPIVRDVGRIGVKCQNFVQYVRKASTILGCVFQMNDDELESYYKQYESFEKNLQFYFLLRVVIAPIVEGIIVLDRLLYLREKGIEKSYLVKLFDPVISPRFYGIVAVRDDDHLQKLPSKTSDSKYDE